MDFKHSLTSLGMAAVVLCIAAALPARAGSIKLVTLTLDASAIQSEFGWTGMADASAFSPMSVDLAEGDTLDLTINFLPGQQLTIDNLNVIWPFLGTGVSAGLDDSGMLSLLDSTGAPLYTSIELSDTESPVNAGQPFMASDFLGLPTSVTFAGLHYVGTVLDYDNPDVTTRNYNYPQLLFMAGDFSTAPVPEPASLLLLGAGLVACFARALVRNRGK